MSGERGAGSMVQTARPDASGLCRPPLGTRHRARRAGAGFTLLEILVVVALIAVLTALVAPSLQGLMGISGRRGALNTVTAVFDQARLAAIENGTTAYVGLPTNAANATNGYSHLIVFRDARPDDAVQNPVAVTRWQRLPTGVYVAGTDSLSNSLTIRELPERTLPSLGGAQDMTKIPALAFNRFGQLQGANSNVTILLGEKVDPMDMSPTAWRGGSNSYYEVRIEPLTGRTVVRDMSTNTATP